MRSVLALFAVLALAACSSSPRPCAPAVQPAPASPCPPGSVYRGVGWGGMPICRSCGVGRCG